MEDSEWETIQPSSSATQSDEDDSEAAMMTQPTPFNEPSIFAPSNHEGVPVFPQQIQDDNLQQPLLETSSPQSSNSSSSAPYASEMAEGELPQRPEERGTLLNASLGILRSWVLRIAYGIRSRIGFWSVASLTAVVTLTLTAYARRWQRRRRLAEKDDTDKLLRLLNQKDEKIKQLLLQIEQMNEILSARRRVPVLRVVVDGPLVIGPRSNWKPAGH